MSGSSAYARSAAEREDLEQDIALALWRAPRAFAATAPSAPSSCASPIGQRRVLVLALEGLGHEEIGQVLSYLNLQLERCRDQVRQQRFLRWARLPLAGLLEV